MNKSYCKSGITGQFTERCIREVVYKMYAAKHVTQLSHYLLQPLTKADTPDDVTPEHMARLRTSKNLHSLIALQ